LEWLRRHVARAHARIAAYKAANPEPTPQTLEEIRQALTQLKAANTKKLKLTVDDVIAVLEKGVLHLIVEWRDPRDRLRHVIGTIWAELDGEKEANPAQPRARERKIIRIVKGEIARIVDEAEATLLAVADAVPIMVRAGMLVQPIVDKLPASHGRMTDVTLLRPLTNANIIYLLTKYAAIFAQYDARSKKWLASDPPSSVATQLLKRVTGNFPRWRASSPHRHCGLTAACSTSPVTIQQPSSGTRRTGGL